MHDDAESVASELRDREPIFHRPEQGTSRVTFESMTVADFWEVGASGAIYDRATILDELDPAIRIRPTTRSRAWW